MNKKLNRSACKIILQSFDHETLEACIVSLKSLSLKIGISNLIGPIYMPNKIKRWTVLRSPHIDKKSREQFEWVIHKRYLEIFDISPSVEKLFLKYLKEQVPVGVGIELKRYSYHPLSSK